MFKENRKKSYLFFVVIDTKYTKHTHNQFKQLKTLLFSE